MLERIREMFLYELLLFFFFKYFILRRHCVGTFKYHPGPGQNVHEYAVYQYRKVLSVSPNNIII